MIYGDREARAGVLVFDADSGLTAVSVGLPAERFSEARKDPEQALERTWRALPEMAERGCRARRATPVMGQAVQVGVGGGVIGDLSGFLASIYMRGIPFYQIPTTLLSMVDSSVGGKTGVNLETGKNMMGTFYQPSGVFIHTDFLRTLDIRNYKGGLSEVIKTALLDDPDLFTMLEENWSE